MWGVEGTRCCWPHAEQRGTAQEQSPLALFLWFSLVED